MKIRSDLQGVVYALLEGGGVAVLAAGDTIPDGATIGEHLTEGHEPAKESDDAGVKRGRRSTPRA